MFNLFLTNQFQLALTLIGFQKEQLPLLRIKDNAVHVGHSQLPETQKEYMKSTMEINFLSLNNNQQIVQQVSEMKDVMEEKWIMHLNTVFNMEMNKNLNILTEELMDPVNIMLLQLPKLSLDTLMSLQEIAKLQELHCKTNPFQLQLMPKHGAFIMEEYLIYAVLHLITEFFQLDQLIIVDLDIGQ